MTDLTREGLVERKPLPAFRLIEDGGLVVARVEHRDREVARREIDHYAMMYAQDGKVDVQERKGKRWVVSYILARARAMEAGRG